MTHSDTCSTHSSPFSSNPIRDRSITALDRDEMLRQLANQTLAKFDIEPFPPSESEDDPAEEWEGIHSEELNYFQEDDSYSIAGSQEDFDDSEDLHDSIDHRQVSQASQQDPELIVFQDPSQNLKKELNLCDQSERRSFMASMLKKQLNNQIAGPSSSSTTNKKRNASTKEDEEEVKLAHLDRSLSNLISHLSEPNKKAKSLGLDAILSSTLPPLTKDRNPQRHPRKIKTGMIQAELQRSLAADKAARISGTVRSSNAKTLTKKQKRYQDGTDTRDRRERKNRTDRPLGTSKGPGGMIKLSSREIKITMNQPNSRSKKRN